MLGRTNITTVKGGTIVSDIASYDWNNATTMNVNSSFKKGFYANNILTAITKSGTVLYTRDGENWEEAALDMDIEYHISDGIWDGHRFVFVGSHATDTEGRCNALIVTTEDFQNYEIMRDCTGGEYDSSAATSKKLSRAYCGKFHSILLNEDATYTIIYSTAEPIIANYGVMNVFFAKGKLEDLQFTCSIMNSIHYDKFTYIYEKALENIYVETARNADSFVFYVKTLTNDQQDHYRHIVGISDYGNSYLSLEEYEGYIMNNKPVIAANMFKIFECKDSLYYMTLMEDENRLVRVKGFSDGTGSVVSSGEDWGFVDAVYFNKCEIFINAHQMLVVKSKENVADKTEGDLVDISYDFSLIGIVKAFEKLYVFGTNGNILVSSDEVKSESATAVKTMSATKALYEAKEYTDRKYAELEERIAKLEEVKGGSTEV